MNGYEFIKKYLGKKIDVDGFPKDQPYQCVDLIKGFIKFVLNEKPQSIGNAIDYWYKKDNNYITKLFKPIKNTPSFVPQPFDIVIFNSGKFGHIAICTGEGNRKNFRVWEQNYPKRANPVQESEKNYKNIAGFLRPKNKNLVFKEEFFTANAYVIFNSDVFADNENNNKIGSVFRNEPIRIYAQGSARSAIQYKTKNGYKIGLVSSENIRKIE